jgi:hypothetical protein
MRFALMRLSTALAAIALAQTAEAQSAPPPIAPPEATILAQGWAPGGPPSIPALFTLFDNGNIDAVENRPTQTTTFLLQRNSFVATIATYHWNHGRGASPGNIALIGRDGRIYGPWRATGSPGQGGVPNAYWNVSPNLTLGPGTYTIIDSDLFTWSQNAGSFGTGHARVEGYPLW